ncbi:MAG: hypothetical protein PHU21_15120 [Elusimicrobia bacterium]|nr:hypothetical protein [Elusimicrobiota bacterium]
MAQKVAHAFAAEREAREAERARQAARAAPLAQAIEAVYKKAAKLSERYSKDPAVKRCTPRGRGLTPTGWLFENLVRPPEGTSMSGGGAIHFVRPGTESLTIGGTNIGSVNVGGMTVGGGSHRSDPGGDLTVALESVRGSYPPESVWSLREARRTLNLIKKDLAACPSAVTAWRGEAVAAVDEVGRDVDAATGMARALYMEDEQKLPPLKRKLRALLFDSP